jgi:hypothetical protein
MVPSLLMGLLTFCIKPPFFYSNLTLNQAIRTGFPGWRLGGRPFPQTDHEASSLWGLGGLGSDSKVRSRSIFSAVPEVLRGV